MCQIANSYRMGAWNQAGLFEFDGGVAHPQGEGGLALAALDVGDVADRRLGSMPGNVPLAKNTANLPKPCVVVVSQIATVDKSRLLEKIGTLPQAVARTAPALPQEIKILVLVSTGP